jgi:hypothetical protein
VYDVITRHGELAGLRALLGRIRECRRGYQFLLDSNETKLILASGRVINKHEMSAELEASISMIKRRIASDDTA